MLSIVVALSCVYLIYYMRLVMTLRRCHHRCSTCAMYAAISYQQHRFAKEILQSTTPVKLVRQSVKKLESVIVWRMVSPFA